MARRSALRWFWWSLAVGIAASGVIVSDENTCARVGAPESGAALQVQGCAWHTNVLESRHAGNSSCEPSRQWLNASGLFRFDSFSENSPQCETLQLDECTYDASEKCLVAQNGEDCYTPPLQLLRKYTENLVRTFPKLFFYTEELPRQCALIQDNVSCALLSGCEWKPTNLSKTEPGSEDEVQEVSVFQIINSAPQVQQIKLRAAKYDSSVVTISLMSRVFSSLDLAMSYFRLVYDDEPTDPIPLNSTAERISSILSDLEVDVPPFTVDVASYASTGIPSSWTISFSGVEQNADRLSLGAFEIRHNPETPKKDQWPESYGPIMLTRHKHNSQRVTIWSNKSLSGGEFILVYRSFDQLTTTVNERETKLLSYDASEDDLRNALLDLISSGSQALSFVSVSETRPNIINDGRKVFRSWDVVFVSVVDEYEIGELLLVPKYKNAPYGLECKGCDAFRIGNRTADASEVSMTMASLVKAPKISGYFQIEMCKFDSSLPGLAFPKLGQSLVPLLYTGPAKALVAPGTYVRIAGLSFLVISSSNNSILLERPFDGFLLERTVPGVKVFVCSATTSSQESNLLARSSPTEFTNYLTTKFPTLAFTVTVAQEPNELNERAWNVSIVNPPNSLDPFLFTTLSELGWKASLSDYSFGSASVSGFFRLAFAGYDGNETVYENLFLNSSFGVNQPSDSSFMVQENGTKPTFVTRQLAHDASALEVEQALEALGNIKSDGVSVTRSTVIRDHPQTNETMRGFAWKITFSAKAIAQFFPPERLESLSPDVPQLAIAEEIFKGSNAQASVITLFNGSGNLNQTNITEYVLAEGKNNSPCVADEKYRDNQILKLDIDSTKLSALQELDANLKRCAGGLNTSKVWNSEDECRLVMFSKNIDPLVRNDMNPDDEANLVDGESTNEPFCVWRAPDKISSELPHAVSPDYVVAFAWNNNIYGGTSGLTRFSNCTVPLIYQSQQLLKLFGLTEEFIKKLDAKNSTLRDDIDMHNNTNISARLSILIEQFNQCYEDVQTYIQLPNPKFIKLWQEIAFFTCYTVSFWYGCGGLFFAHRTRKLGIFHVRSLGNAILFSIGGVVFGGIIGFVLGSIPAAIIANIYAAIPHNLPFGSAISLGIGQGSLIIYFDMGRGMRTTVE